MENVDTQILKKIYCPKCNAEYLPAEVFVPKSFIGEPFDIEKDTHGKILNYNGQSLNLDESYRCDYCNTEFKISADVVFNTSVDETKTFNNVYKSSLYKNKRYKLDED